MAIHSSTMAWKIPWDKEPGRLQSMGSQRVGHDTTFFFLPQYSLCKQGIKMCLCLQTNVFSLCFLLLLLFTFSYICVCIYMYIGEGDATPLQYSCLENPWTEEPGRPQCRGLLRVGHD